MFRAAAVYVAVAFAALEGADIVLPRLGLPDRAMTVLVILVVIGFPCVLILAWVFDLTPGGLKRAAEESPTDLESPFSPASRRGLQASILVLATLLFAAAAWWWIPRSPPFRSIAGDPQAIVVLPFEIRGSDAVAYLREGMVDLLSTKLDGVGGIRVVDPRATFALLPDDRDSSLSIEDVRSVSARLGAGRALQGSVVWVGGQLQIRASVYGAEADPQTDASVEGPGDDLFGLVDRLVSQLVSGGITGGDAQLFSLEALTTQSNEALRLYLDGVRSFRAGEDPAEALARLERAVELDSTFALAAYWAGYAAEYLGVEGRPVPMLQLASRHQGRLGPRDRMRLAAALAGAEGRYSDAIPRYEALVQRYPDDVAGWFQLAEQLAHTGHFVGKAMTAARPAYERALELDPQLTLVYYHLAVIGGSQADSVALRRWAARIDSLGAEPLWPTVINLSRGAVLGDSALLRASLEAYRNIGPIVPAATLAGSLIEMATAILESELEAVRALVKEYSVRAVTDTGRTVAARGLARLDGALGRLSNAEEVLRTAGPALSELLPYDLAWLALHPAASSERARAARILLTQTRPDVGTGQAAVRHYLLARLARKLEEQSLFDREVRELRALKAVTAEIESFAKDLSQELAAVDAQSRGKPAAALDSLLVASYWRRQQSWPATDRTSYFDWPLADRVPLFLRAELLWELGQDSAAAVWYQIAAEGAWHRGPALLRLAEIRAQAGDPDQAAALYRRLLRLWERADAEVEPSTDLARRRLSELSRTAASGR